MSGIECQEWEMAIQKRILINRIKAERIGHEKTSKDSMSHKNSSSLISCLQQQPLENA